MRSPRRRQSPVSALRGKPPDQSETKHLAAYHQGFSLHAGVHLHANDRQGLAHLCGYGARPPLTQERLSALPGGKLAYRMKRSLGDGREVLILEPRELLRRLATLVPPPRAHLVRYHGVFGPASKWRKEIVPAPSQSACPARSPTFGDAPDGSRPPTRPPRPLDSRIPWNELLLRVFREDILACPCGGRRKVIAFIDEKPVIERILGHLGFPTTGPPTAPARLPAPDQSAALARRRPRAAAIAALTARLVELLNFDCAGRSTERPARDFARLPTMRSGEASCQNDSYLSTSPCSAQMKMSGSAQVEMSVFRDEESRRSVTDGPGAGRDEHEGVGPSGGHPAGR